MVNPTIKNFKNGIVVYLLANVGFRMMIERIDSKRNVIVCGWIGDDGKLLSGEFKPYQLGKVSELNRELKAY